MSRVRIMNAIVDYQLKASDKNFLLSLTNKLNDFMIACKVPAITKVWRLR